MRAMLAWLLLGIVVGCGLVRVCAGYPRAERTYAVLAPREVAFLSAVGNSTFPAGGVLSPSGDEVDLAGYTDHWLTLVPPRMRLLMRLLLFLVEHGTLFLPVPGPRGWRRFSSLSTEQQAAALEGWRTSRLYPRRLVFMSLRAILSMGYLAHPRVLRQLRQAPLDFETPVCEADLLFPPIGRGPEAIRYSSADLTPPSDGTPLSLEGPLHPRYAEKIS
ncbi:MAG: hypothetical protein JRS35_02710 [Deltaproteobacteria bacterium]|nr:hypothetical protein [Deltaproteobacteria bacterium]